MTSGGGAAATTQAMSLTNRVSFIAQESSTHGGDCTPAPLLGPGEFLTWPRGVGRGAPCGHASPPTLAAEPMHPSAAPLQPSQMHLDYLSTGSAKPLVVQGEARAILAAASRQPATLQFLGKAAPTNCTGSMSSKGLAAGVATGPSEGDVTGTSFNADTVTTVMLRNIPNRYSKNRLINEINDAGFLGSFDFFYLPIDPDTKANRGYALLNFTSPHFARQFSAVFEGRTMGQLGMSKVASVSPASTQGFEANFALFASARANAGDTASRPLFLREPESGVWATCGRSSPGSTAHSTMALLEQLVVLGGLLPEQETCVQPQPEAQQMQPLWPRQPQQQQWLAQQQPPLPEPQPQLLRRPLQPHPPWLQPRCGCQWEQQLEQAMERLDGEQADHTEEMASWAFRPGQWPQPEQALERLGEEQGGDTEETSRWAFQPGLWPREMRLPLQQTPQSWCELQQQQLEKHQSQEVLQQPQWLQPRQVPPQRLQQLPQLPRRMASGRVACADPPPPELLPRPPVWHPALQSQPAGGQAQGLAERLGDMCPARPASDSRLAGLGCSGRSLHGLGFAGTCSPPVPAADCDLASRRHFQDFQAMFRTGKYT